MEPVMERRCCEHCGQPLMQVTCDDCDGFGGWWEPAPEPDGWRWRVCGTCQDSETPGQRWKCSDFMACPGTRWYPLDARCAGIVGMLAAAKEGNENAQ